MAQNLTILHTADVHLGAKFSFLGPKGKEHRRQLLSTLSRLVDLALTVQVDVFLVAGDLFDSPRPSLSILEKVAGEFRRLQEAGVEVALVPGTHDRLGKDSIYHDEAWDSFQNLHIFRGGGWEELVLEKRGVSLYGWGYDGKREGDVLQELQLSTSRTTPFRVGLLHGSLALPGVVEEDEVIFRPETIGNCGLDYLALGHWHSFRDCSGGKTVACYCGAPEPISLNDRGGKAVLVTLAEGKVPEVKTIKVGRRSFLQKVVDMELVGSHDHLRNQIKEWADVDSFIEVVLKGRSFCEDLVDTAGLEEELSPLFFGIRIRDESSLASLDLKERRPTGVIAREFIELADEQIQGRTGEERKVAEEALRLGLAYLEGRCES
jgi:DNA repair exonuclease SbcCD nuclease subunit